MSRFALGCVAGLAGACGPDADDEPTSAEATQVALPGVTGAVLLDDLHFAVGPRRVVAAPGGSRRVHRIDVDAATAESFTGFGSGAASADEAGGLLFVADREARSIDVVEVSSGRILSDVLLDSTPDYVRHSSATNEVWVTEPSERRIEILVFAAPASPVLRSAGFVVTGDRTEGLAFDVKRRRAFTHGSIGRLHVIDVDTRKVLDAWPTPCATSHGIPTVDEANGFVFVGCLERAAVGVLSTKDNGQQLGAFELGTGQSALAYSPQLHHFYLRGDPGKEIAILDIPASGVPVLLGKLPTPERGHVMAADDRAHLWVADPVAGRLLRFRDAFAPR